MRPKIPKISREVIVENWLRGTSRNKIAEQCGVSNGTVTAIVEEWSRSIGKDVAIQLRDFSLALDRVGLTLPKCAAGLRIASLMKDVGVHEDEYETFLRETYAACRSLGLQPKYAAQILQDIFSFSENVSSVSDIYALLSKLREEKEALQRSIAPLEERIKVLRAEEEAAEELRDVALKNDRMTQASLKWYCDARDELKKSGVSVENIPRVARFVQWFSEEGLDANEIASTFSDYQVMKNAKQNLEKNIEIVRTEISGLENKNASLEESISKRSQSLSQLQDLENMGIGMKDLKMISYLVQEIARENGFDAKDALKKFFDDICHEYDKKLAFDTKITDQQTQLRKLIFLKNSLLENLGTSAADSLQNDRQQEQRLNAAKILNIYPDLVQQVAAQVQKSVSKVVSNVGSTKGNDGTASRAQKLEGGGDNGDIAGYVPSEGRQTLNEQRLKVSQKAQHKAR